MLDQLAHVTIAYLLTVTVASFFAGAGLLGRAHVPPSLLVEALLGTAGSAMAALTSCLDRYATGFERERGSSYPRDASGGKFNRRFARWLFVRPFLGAVVAPLFVWGINHLTKNPEPFLSTPESIAFTCFIAGLLAKSVLDLVKNLFKNVFKA